MKILHFSTYDGEAGAAKAATRIHNMFLNNSIESTLVVSKKFTDTRNCLQLNSNFTNFLNINMDAVISKFTKVDNDQEIFSSNIFSFTKFKYLVKETNPDAVFLYWLNAGFLSVQMVGELLKFNKRVYWRLSDMWPFTGGCHYSSGCSKYMNTCERCPKLLNNIFYDHSKNILAKKKHYWNLDNLTIISPSIWIQEKASRSSLLKSVPSVNIPPVVDVTKFKIRDRYKVRKELGLPEDKFIILLGAYNVFEDQRKGGPILVELVKSLAENKKLLFIVFGQENEIFLSDNIINIGKVHDEEKLAKHFSSSDVFISASLEENLANTVLESLCSGVPVLAFDSGGTSEVVHHKKNGYLVDQYTSDSLYLGLTWILRNMLSGVIRESISKIAVETFSENIIFAKYKKLLIAAPE